MPSPPPQKKRGRRKGKERKGKKGEKKERHKETISRHNLFFRAYIDLRWPMGWGQGATAPLNEGEI